MMMCLRHMLLYVVLLPVPLSILFLSTSPSSPFLSRPALHPGAGRSSSSNTTVTSTFDSSSSSSASTTSTSPAQDVPLTEPILSRTWLDLNHGRIFDPLLHAYRLDWDSPSHAHSTSVPQSSDDGLRVPEDNASRHRIHWSSWLSSVSPGWLLSRLHLSGSTSTSASTSASDRQKPQSEPPVPSRPLPSNYLDLRWKELGFVVDFGWRRTEEGLSWEMEEWRRSSAAAAARKPSANVKLEQEQEQAPASSSAGEVDGAEGGEKPLERETEVKTRGLFSRMSFLGSW